MICVYAGYLANDYNISGVTVLFLKQDEDMFAGVYSLNIIGDMLYNFEFDSSPEKVYFKIIKAKNSNDIVPGNDKKIHDAFFSSMREDEIRSLKNKIGDNDTGAAAFELRKIISGVLNSDDLKIKAHFSNVTSSEFLEINAMQRYDLMTVNEKAGYLKNIYGNNTAVIDRVIKDSIADISYALITDGKTFSSAVFVSNLTNKMIAGVFSPEKASSGSCSINDFFADFYSKIIKNEGSSVNYYSGGDVSSLCAAVCEESSERLKATVSPFLKDSSASAGISVRFGRVNSVVLGNLVDIAGVKNVQKEHEDKNYRKTMDVSLVLSPTKGKKISQLLPGNVINILFDKNNPAAMTFINKMKLMRDNGTVAPIEAEVYSVKRDAKKGFIVYSKITDELYGKSSEEEDVKIKYRDPEYDKLGKTSSKSMLIGIAAGIAVIALIALLAFAVL